MELEELDVIELIAEVSVEPGWRIDPDTSPATLPQGARGVVVHRHDGEPIYEVEFMDTATGKTLALATLRADQMRVVERFTLGEE